MITTVNVRGTYENGVIHLRRRLPFPNNQRVELKIEIPSFTQRTRAIIHISSKVAKLIATPHKFSVLES